MPMQSPPPSYPVAEPNDKTEPPKAHGILKLFIGYAPGVGKTFSMLSEGIRRRQRGEDVVIGSVETHGRRPIADLAQKLETIPTRKVDAGGAIFEELDLDAVLVRNPGVALIDELPHSNLRGSRHAKRYQDVMELLDAGISVLSTVNIQHVESLTPAVKRLTGVEVRETVPDWILERADEVVMTDLTPEALRMRLRRGDVYPHANPDSALNNFFKLNNLIALRELALQQVARAVERNLHNMAPELNGSMPPDVHESIVVCIDSSPSSQELIARGARLAAPLNGDFYVVHVRCGKEDAGNDLVLRDNLQFARDLHAETVELEAVDIPRALGEFAQAHGATQIIFGRLPNGKCGGSSYWRKVSRVLQWAPLADLHLVNLLPPTQEVSSR